MSGIYAKYHVQIMLLFVNTTTSKRFVIFTLFQIKLKYHCSKPIKLQKFVMEGSICPSSQLVELLMAGQVPIWNFDRTRIRVFFIAELFAG